MRALCIGFGLLAACGTTNQDDAAQALAQGEDALHQLIDSYVDGTIPVFHGTASASESFPAATGADLAFSNAAVIARLQLRPASASDFANASGNAAVLTIHAPTDYVVLEQTSGTTTWIGQVLANDQSSNLAESCDGCVADLHGKPSSISIQSATASGAIDSNSLQTTVTAQLSAVAPSAVAFSDILTLGFPDDAPGTPTGITFGTWQQEGADMVAIASGTFGTTAQGHCGTTTPFTIQVYVDASNPSDFGTRNYVAGVPMKLCAP